jgi:hypothetical protein
MLDVRRLLPATPVALVCGLGATLSAAAEAGGPDGALVIGVLAAAVTLVGMYQLLAGWTDRARRQVGYATAVVLGIVVGAGFFLAAIAASMCSLWGEQCTPEETELVERLFVSGVIAVGAVPALYWVIDHLTLRRR